MQEERDERLHGILTIAADTWRLSLREAIRRSGYRDVRAHLQTADLVRLLRAEPALVDLWLAYSEDKRTSGGWYVTRDGEIGVVCVPESRLHFPTLEEAVAEYVVRELDFWVDVR
jgi:hypothetical protein